MYSARCARRGERRASKSEQRELHVASATPFQTRGMPACTGRHGPCRRVAGGAGGGRGCVTLAAHVEESKGQVRTNDES